MNPLVFIVEGDDCVKKLLSVVLEKNNISFIFASNLSDAIKLFESNEEKISYLALTGNFDNHLTDSPETLVLAKIIADSQSFKGTVFAMSSVPEHCIILKEVIGDRCEILVTDCPASIKFHTIRKISQMITEKRKEGQKS
jgi:hypothetical protein